jgi:Tol biopolymer transport system component
VVRAPVTGGSAQPVFTVQRDAQLRCAKAPATLCAITEKTADRKQLAFTAFDPVAGRGRELMRIDADPNEDDVWDLSPDGVRIAVVKSSGGPIRIFPLDGGPAQELHAKGWSTSQQGQNLEWASDGKGLLISGDVQGESGFLHVDLEGNGHALWRLGGGVAESAYGIPSPDGRHLAILSWSGHGNIWMIENF